MADPRHNGPAASLRRIRLIARHTLGEARHQRLVWLLGLTAAGLVPGALGLRDFNFGGAELKFIGDFGLGVTGLGGTLLAALAPAQLFFGDIAGGAAACVLTRPVRRGEYLLGKFAGVAAVLALFVLVLALVLAAVLAWRGAQLGAGGVPLPVFLQACALQWMKATLVTAMTLLVCSYAGSALFASGAGLLLALAGHLRGFAGGGHWSWLRAWPDLGLFDAEPLLADGQPAPAAWLLLLAAYWAAYLLLFLLLAAHAFRRREF